jgi:hypothetical protein
MDINKEIIWLLNLILQIILFFIQKHKLIQLFNHIIHKLNQMQDIIQKQKFQIFY